MKTRIRLFLDKNTFIQFEGTLKELNDLDYVIDIPNHISKLLKKNYRITGLKK